MLKEIENKIRENYNKAFLMSVDVHVDKDDEDSELLED